MNNKICIEHAYYNYYIWCDNDIIVGWLSDCDPKKDIPNVLPMGQLWGIFYEYFDETFMLWRGSTIISC